MSCKAYLNRTANGTEVWDSFRAPNGRQCVHPGGHTGNHVPALPVGCEVCEVQDTALTLVADYGYLCPKCAAERAPKLEPVPAPIPMILTCPSCNTRHVDVELATKPHHTHACQSCGMHWRPALVATCGVRFLPGCKDEP